MFVKRRIKFRVVFAFLLIFLLIPAGVSADHIDEVPVQDFADGSVIEGSNSALERNEDSIEIELETTVDSNDAITVWAVVWNDPSLCNGPCGEDDIGIEGNSILWSGAGGVADENGDVEVEGEFGVDDAPGEILLGPGLTDPAGAEVHLIVRTHGDALNGKGQVKKQTTTLNGGCKKNICEDIQFAVHLP